MNEKTGVCGTAMKWKQARHGNRLGVSSAVFGCRWCLQAFVEGKMRAEDFEYMTVEELYNVGTRAVGRSASAGII